MRMGKQSKSKRTDNIGKGNITPIQIAFIVDCYLSDNNYTQTRSAFRSEASNLVSNFPQKEVPNSLLGLAAILDEYIWLKGQRVSLNQEKIRLEQENLRVQNLLKGMQDVMSAYNASASGNVNANVSSLPPIPSSSLPTSAAVVPHVDLTVGSTPGYYPAYNAPVVMPASGPLTTNTNPSNFLTPVMNQGGSKRRGSKDVSDAPLIAKRSRRSSNSKPLPPTGGIQESIQRSSAVQQSSTRDNLSNGSPVQGSNVAKCLFNQPNQSPSSNTSSPKTPPIASSSQTDKSVSPVGNCSTITSSKDLTPQQITSINSTITSSQMVYTSPAKQISYCSIERNHSISTSSPAKTSLSRPSQRDHVKGRLNFDASDMPSSFEKPASDGLSTSESDREGEFFDLDLANLDALGVDFNFSDLLLDFDIDTDGIGCCSNQLAEYSSPDGSFSESPHTSGNVNMGANQVMSRCSTVTEVHTEKDMDHLPGPETVTTIKSITKCIKILSPMKSQRSMHQGNSSAVGKY